MHYVQASPSGGGRPRKYSQRYAIVGDPAIPTIELCFIEPATGRLTWAQCEPLPAKSYSPITTRQLWWSGDGRHVYLVQGNRGDRRVRLLAIERTSGAVNQILEETSATQIQTNPLGYGVPNVRVLATGETIWWSERSGWGHLYLHDGAGSLRALTSGAWLVRDLLAVDEVRRTAVFSGSGRESGLDPYARQLYRLGIDHGDLVRISEDLLDHDAIGSPSGRYVIDRISSCDMPTASILCHASGDVILHLEQGDAGLLYEAGWTAPERFHVKAADGTTDLFGLLYKPPDFDSSLRYPVLDDMYPGPQINNASFRFPGSGTMHGSHAASMATLGFVVVLVDGRCTPLRGKAFQEHCRGQHDGDSLDDHVAAIRQLATERPWMDLNRVGIYGMSGGGRAAAAALLRHPDFFKVGVAASGNHDDLVYRASWGEKYVGFPEDADYHDHANPTHAHRLRGKLLLIHGELDDNVTPYLSLRLVSALIAANKDFDLLIVPNGDHFILRSSPYTVRRMWDYFVRHLRREEPPDYRIGDIPFDLDEIAEEISGA